MTSTLPLLLGTEPSDWTTWVAVGTGVTLLGTAVFFLSGGLKPPNGGISYGSYLLSLFVIGLGVTTILGGLVVRRRRGASDPIP